MDVNTVLSATLEGYELAKAKLARAEEVIKQLQEENAKLQKDQKPKKKGK